MSIRQAKIRGEVVVAKPVLMLALIDGIDSGVFTNNRFALNEWLEERYQSLMDHYTRSSQFDKPADIKLILKGISKNCLQFLSQIQ